MPDLEISNLPEIQEAGVQGTDPLALADISASETKKVSVKDLIAAGVTFIDDGDIPAAKVAGPFAANTVATATIQNDAINADKLATDSVTADAIAANAVGASELANNAVDSDAIATNAVVTTKIADLNVTTDKLASNARLIGLDSGTKRIGIAICDDKRKIASPYKTIEYKNMDYLVKE